MEYTQKQIEKGIWRTLVDEYYDAVGRKLSDVDVSNTYEGGTVITMDNGQSFKITVTEL